MGSETMTKLLPATLLLLASSIASAQPSINASTAVKPEGRDSVNLSPLGLIFGDVDLSYEHLFDGGKGIIVEAGGGRGGSSDARDTHGSMAVGYRWHWQKKQNSGFLGITLTQGFGSASVADDTGMSYDMTTRSTMLTGNIGKRWMLGDSNWNITLRFGLGWGHHTVQAKETSSGAKMAEQKLNDALTHVPVGVEGELSIGYVF